MEFIYNDGGRKESGYKGEARDCVVRAISIATKTKYQKVYDDLWKINGKSPRNGISKITTIKKYIQSIGWKWVACMKIGDGCKVHLKKDELPSGTIICRLSRHIVAVIDGVIHDTYDCSRNETRCVYGYWIKSNKKGRKTWKKKSK